MVSVAISPLPTFEPRAKNCPLKGWRNWSVLCLQRGNIEFFGSSLSSVEPELARNILDAKGSPEPDPASRRDLERPRACAAAHPDLS